ncbi:ArnT family glycosyltransferase [Candidatus Leptofilum sp.]|uniref:ArnT family glycosyltransferase n=1 Tax=Candidatus Leptofilum sp. TaxID=3241576 RepID=UPI003B5CCA48
MSLASLLLIFIILLLPGIASWLFFIDDAKLKLTGLESIFLWLLAGTAVISWLSLTLAELNQFALPLLLAVALVPSLLVIGWAVRNGRLQRAFSGLKWQWQDGVVAVLLLIAVVLSGRPSEYIVGGRDHGVYVNTGVHIVKTGGILVYDAEMTAVPPELRSVLVRPETRLHQAGFPGPWSEGQRVSGLTIRDTDAGIYLPHAFHLYPALIAVFYAVGGTSLALFTTMWLTLLGSLAIYLTVARLWGRPVGLLTLLLLTFSVTQVWFTGYPTAEMMVQLFFWGGLFALSLLLESGSRATAVLAGACFGLLSLTKLDTVLIPPLLIATFLYLWLRQQFRPAYWWGIGIYLLLTLQAVWHATFIATIYFVDHLVRTLLPGFLAEPLAAAADGYPYPMDWLARLFAANWVPMLLTVLLLVLTILLLRYRQKQFGRGLGWLFQQPGRWQVGLSAGLGVIVVGTAVLSQTSELAILAPPEQAVRLTRLYLTRAGLVAGGIGLILLIYQAKTTAVRLTLFIAIGNIAPLYLLGAGTALDHFWVVRRFITVAFPLFIVGMAWLIWQLRPRDCVRWFVGIVPLGLLLLLLAGFGQHVRWIAGVVEYDGLTTQLATFTDRFPPEAILLMETGSQAQRLELPIWFLYDQTVFTIRQEVREEAALQTAVSHWQANGRPVFWLAANGVTPPAWSEGRRQLAFSQTIDTPLMETPRDHIPVKINRYQVPFDVYQLGQP